MQPPKISPLERQLNLVIALLNTRVHLTAEEIRQSVKGYDATNGEAGRMMFERDKQLLKSLGIPITVENTDITGRIPGYRIDKKDYQLPPMQFTSEEQTVIALAMQLYRGKGYGDLQRAFDKLEHHGGEAAVGLLGVSTTSDTEEFDILNAVAEAAAKHRTVTFSYHTAHDISAAERRVEPWGVVTDDGHWYIIGFDCDRQDIRVFRLSRVVGAVTDTGITATAERPAIVVRELLRQKFSAVRRYISAALSVDEDVSEELLLAATTVENEPGKAERRLLSFDAIGYQWLRDMILADTPHVVVVSPPDLAADVEACLTRIAHRSYEGEEDS